MSLDGAGNRRRWRFISKQQVRIGKKIVGRITHCENEVKYEKQVLDALHPTIHRHFHCFVFCRQTSCKTRETNKRDDLTDTDTGHQLTDWNWSRLVSYSLFGRSGARSFAQLNRLQDWCARFTVCFSRSDSSDPSSVFVLVRHMINRKWFNGF